MKKFLTVIVLSTFAVAAFAADKNTSKTAKTAKTAAKPAAEFVIVESAKYEAGKQDEQVTAGLAAFLGVTPKVTALSYEEAKKRPQNGFFGL